MEQKSAMSPFLPPLYGGYPVGYLIAWRNPAASSRVACRPPESASSLIEGEM